jgi:hypothetical protein
MAARTHRTVGVLTGALLLLVATAQAGLAHEEIAPATVETGTPVFLTLSAANDTDSPITRIAVTAPEGAEMGETSRSPAGWKAAKSGATVTWTGGSLAPEAWEQYGFELEQAAQPGTLTFTVALTSGGDTEQVRVPVSVVAAGTSGQAPAPSVTVAPALAADAGDAADRAQGRANLALMLGAAGLLLGLVAVGVAVARAQSRGTTPKQPSPQDF